VKSNGRRYGHAALSCRNQLDLNYGNTKSQDALPFIGSQNGNGLNAAQTITLAHPEYISGISGSFEKSAILPRLMRYAAERPIFGKLLEKAGASLPRPFQFRS
jgi:hypothetical protein